VYTKLGDRSGQERVARHLAQVHLKVGNYKESLGYSIGALSLSETDDLKAQNHHNAGIALKYLRNSSAALEHYLEALNYYESIPAKTKVCELRIEVGLVYYYINDLDKAIEHYEVAADQARYWSLNEWEARALNNIGNAYVKKGKVEKAGSYLRRSIEIKRDLSRDLNLTTANILANIYFDAGKIDSAEYFTNLAIDSYRTLHEVSQYIDALLLKVEIKESLGQLDSAYLYMKKATGTSGEVMALRQRMQSENARIHLLLLEARKTQELLQLDAEEKNRKRFWFILLATLTGLGLGGFILYILRKRAHRMDPTGIVKYLPLGHQYRAELLIKENSEYRRTIQQITSFQNHRLKTPPVSDDQY
jgi:tetratricopeptide (TPR) repeat protein